MPARSSRSLPLQPAPVGIRGGGDVLDPSRRERDEEQDLDPLEKRGLDGEEVTARDARRPRAQEHAQRRMAPLQCRLKTSLKQHLPHRVADTVMPKPLSSPTMRLYPQCGFSRARGMIRERGDDS